MSEADIASNFLSALDRLKQRAAQSGCSASKIRITPSSVAAEAGHSRTLIGLKECAYPDVRKKILKEMRREKRGASRAKGRGEEPTESYDNLVKKLRQADTLNTTLLRELEHQKERVLDATRRVERLRSNVVPFKKPED